MEFYLAPLEGVTGYIFRNTVHERFGEGIDKYFTPFIEPHLQKKNLKQKELNDLLPDHNKGIHLVPQIMTNSAEAWAYLEKEIRPFGYTELNLNLGCPSPTVVTKGRGSGMLQDPKKLDELLAGIFEKTEYAVSVKTRIGYEDPEEWPALLEIFNKYPLKELIIHTRVRTEHYQGNTHRDAFCYALKNSRHRLVYNGDINSVADYQDLLHYFECNADGRQPDAIMAGRGMMRDPLLLSNLAAAAAGKTPRKMTKKELQEYSEALQAGYQELLSGETPVLHKMKEVWTWLIKDFPNSDKLLKKIVKAKKLSEFNAAVGAALDLREW